MIVDLTQPAVPAVIGAVDHGVFTTSTAPVVSVAFPQAGAGSVAAVDLAGAAGAAVAVQVVPAFPGVEAVGGAALGIRRVIADHANQIDNITGQDVPILPFGVLVAGGVESRVVMLFPAVPLPLGCTKLLMHIGGTFGPQPAGPFAGVPGPGGQIWQVLLDAAAYPVGGLSFVLAVGEQVTAGIYFLS